MSVTRRLALWLFVAVSAAVAAEQEFFVNKGHTIYHKPGCSYLQVDAQKVGRGEIMSQHHFPCPFCRPFVFVVRSAISEGPKPPPPNGDLSLAWTTHVYLRSPKTLIAKKAKEGDQVELEVSEDVTRDGMVVISRGAPAVARVVAIVRRGMKGKAGRIQVEVLSTTDILGNRAFLDGLMDEIGTQGFQMEDINEFAGEALSEPLGFYVVPHIYATACVLYVLQWGGDAVLPKGRTGRARLAWNVSYNREKLSEANRRLQLERARRFSGNARLYVYRNPLKHWPRGVSLYLNATALPAITARQVLTMLVPPGAHVLSTHGAQLDLRLGSEREYYVKADDPEHLRLVEDKQGNHEIYALEAVRVDLAFAAKHRIERTPGKKGAGSCNRLPS